MRRPLTADRPQSERSSTTACTVKQERLELTRHPAVTGAVAKDPRNKMDSVAEAYTHNTHSSMHAGRQAHLADTCPLVTVSKAAARAHTSYSALPSERKVFISAPALFIPCITSSHADKTRIDMLQRPVSTSALPERVQ